LRKGDEGKKQEGAGEGFEKKELSGGIRHSEAEGSRGHWGIKPKSEVVTEHLVLKKIKNRHD